jgi:hypothetical protein
MRRRQCANLGSPASWRRPKLAEAEPLVAKDSQAAQGHPLRRRGKATNYRGEGGMSHFVNARNIDGCTALVKAAVRRERRGCSLD